MTINTPLYLRIEKVANIDIPEGLSYEAAIEYGRQQDAEGFLYYDLFIDVMYADGDVANESGYQEIIGVPV